MFHPKNFKRLTPTLWEVNDTLVAWQKDGWYCDTCKGEIFRIGGRKQFPCRHVRAVLRKELEVEKWLNDISQR